MILSELTYVQYLGKPTVTTSNLVTLLQYSVPSWTESSSSMLRDDVLVKQQLQCSCHQLSGDPSHDASCSAHSSPVTVGLMFNQQMTKNLHTHLWPWLEDEWVGKWWNDIWSSVSSWVSEPSHWGGTPFQNVCVWTLSASSERLLAWELEVGEGGEGEEVLTVVAVKPADGSLPHNPPPRVITTD